MAPAEGIRIRRADEGDIAALVDFNCGIARETEDKELNRTIVTGGVTRAFEQGDEVAYYLAELEGSAIGSLMVTREWSDWRNGWLAWIQSVYVVPEHRGQGVFRLILDRATEEIRKNPDVVGLRLYVENENSRAQAVYERTGFKDPHYKVLEKIFD